MRWSSIANKLFRSAVSSYVPKVFFTMATQARDYDQGRSAMSALHEMSHGEGFLEIMLAHMRRLAGQGAQFIVATHAPILLGLPGAQILQFDDDGVLSCNYEDTDAYRITASSIHHRDLLLHHLFADEEQWHRFRLLGAAVQSACRRDTVGICWNGDGIQETRPAGF